MRHGQGVYTTPQGEKYEGNFKNGKRNGYGVFKWASGNIYKGHFSDDFREGYGEMVWTDGTQYKGEWKSGVQHGPGELHMPDNYHVKGIFENNVLVCEQKDVLGKHLRSPSKPESLLKKGISLTSSPMLKLSKKSLSEKFSPNFAFNEQKRALDTLKDLKMFGLK